MQTFLPLPNIYDSAMALDMQRLNKQILESDQMINAELINNNKFYKNHPARKMWANNIEYHKMYRDTMLLAWYKRGGKGTRTLYNNYELYAGRNCPDKPWWIRDNKELNKLCQSHRKALLIKNFDYYKDKFPEDIDELVLAGKDLKGYAKLITRGKNKGKYKQFTPTEHKQQFIRDNNIYYWCNFNKKEG